MMLYNPQIVFVMRKKFKKQKQNQKNLSLYWSVFQNNT